METLTAIFTRRSIRKYTKQVISQEFVVKLLEAAMHAPSARNLQPWQFIVINEREKLDDLSEIHPYGKMLKEATLTILVCGDRNLESNDAYLLQNCVASTQNILLAAHDLGLGAVWLGVYPREQRINDIRKYFNLPDHILPISLISLGYPAETKEIPERFRKERVHYNGW
ncbi:nitroreductase family protein [candidate division KSB1 bacterium]